MGGPEAFQGQRGGLVGAGRRSGGCREINELLVGRPVENNDGNKGEPPAGRPAENNDENNHEKPARRPELAPYRKELQAFCSAHVPKPEELLRVTTWRALSR